MMRVVPARLTPPSGREALNYGEGHHPGLTYIFQNSLQRTLGEFREHHKACSVRRKGAAAIEAQRESQRTDFLAKKYMETVRQEHSTSVSIGLVNSTSTATATAPGSGTNNTSASSHQQQQLQYSSSTSSTTTTPTGSNVPLLMSSDESKESLASSTVTTSSTGSSSEANHTTTSTTTAPAVTHSSPMSSGEKSLTASGVETLTTKPSTMATKDLSIKAEPLSNGGVDSGCSSCSQTQQSSSMKVSNGGGNITRSNSAGKVRSSRLRRPSKDIIQRSLSLSQSTPLSSDNDSENDLTFTADDAYRLGTPLKPLEEETTMPSIPPLRLTPPPSNGNNQLSSSQQSSGSRSTTSTPSSTVATPTCTSSLSTPVVPPVVESSSLLMELDAFSKVMNQVEQQEKAKERRQSCPNQTPPIPAPPLPSKQQIIDSPAHLLSPPPYSINGGGVFPSTTSNQQPAHVMLNAKQPQQYGGMPLPQTVAAAAGTTAPRLQSCYESRNIYQPPPQQPHMGSFDGTANIHSTSVRMPPGIHSNNTPPVHPNTLGIHSNQDFCQVMSTSGDSSSCQSPHLQLQHPPTHSTHGQIGALLQSPTCSQPPSSYKPLNHSYQPSMSSPVLHSSYPLWEGMNGGGGGNGSVPPHSFRVGQKRPPSMSSLQYMSPQTKVTHSTISHHVTAPDIGGIPNELSLQTFQNHPIPMGTTHVTSYSHGDNYSHMS